MTFDTSQFRGFRYGWPVVLASTFGVSLGMAPLPFYTIGVFAQPLAEEFGWGIDQILLGLVPFCIVTVISAPMAGYLSDRHGLLLRLRLLTLHGCRFCNQGDRRDALAACLTEKQIDAFDDPENGPFTDAEKALLALGDQLLLTEPTGTLNPAPHRELAKHFNDAEILELGLVGGILAGVAKFMFAYDLVEKEDSCPFHAVDQ